MGIFLQMFHFIPHPKVITTGALYKLQEVQNSLQVNLPPFCYVAKPTIKLTEVHVTVYHDLFQVSRYEKGSWFRNQTNVVPFRYVVMTLLC